MFILLIWFVAVDSNDVVPVVMGARLSDYEAVAPHHSFIHVDQFESPRHLAEYLLELDKNPTKYNDYFRWKSTGHFSPVASWCRVCTFVHHMQSHSSMWYRDVEHWWKGEPNEVCVTNKAYDKWNSWKNITQMS